MSKKTDVVNVSNNKGKKEEAKKDFKLIDLSQGHKVNVSVSWIKAKAATGEVDLDVSCLLFDKFGKYRETIFWDNLQTKGVKHKGDEKLDEDEDSIEEKKENSKASTPTETIKVNFKELDETICNIIFILNIFNNKTFASLTSVDLRITSGSMTHSKYTLPSDMERDCNTIIFAKIFKISEDSDWYSTLIASPHNVPQGQVVDVLIPFIVREPLRRAKDKNNQINDGERMVEPLVPTWSSISIEILEGRGLNPEDYNARSDPYVKLYCGSWAQRTKVKKETLNPVWDDTKFQLQYAEAEKEKEITFIVKDYDRIGPNDYLGQLKISIAKIPLNKQMDRWFKLTPTQAHVKKRKEKKEKAKEKDQDKDKEDKEKEKKTNTNHQVDKFHRFGSLHLRILKQ